VPCPALITESEREVRKKWTRLEGLQIQQDIFVKRKSTRNMVESYKSTGFLEKKGPKKETEVRSQGERRKKKRG